MDMMTWLGIYVLALVALFLLRNVVGLFWSVATFFAVTVAYLNFGFDPPVPASVMVLFVGTTLIAVLIYLTSSEENREAFLAPIIAVMVRPNLLILRILLLLGLPALMAWVAYQGALPSEAAPPKVRSVHPSPPNTMNVIAKGMAEAHVFDIIKHDSPLRELKESDPEKFAGHVDVGRKVYYQNCYYCHGDVMAADGHYASAVNPPPANFQDPGTIAMLEEAYLYWRVVKGGPGLPDAGTPWDSSMPVWEKMLTEDEMWSVIAYMYEYTGYKPRKKEGLGEGH
jgi:mono/diheme cytochrome c family protein